MKESWMLNFTLRFWDNILHHLVMTSSLTDHTDLFKTMTPSINLAPLRPFLKRTTLTGGRPH